jgi:hypothetical protein
MRGISAPSEAFQLCKNSATPVHKIVDAPVARLASLNWKLVAIALNSGRLALLPSLSVEQLHGRQEELT